MKILHCLNSLKTVGGAEKIVDKLISDCPEHDVLEMYRKGFNRNLRYQIREVFHFVYSIFIKRRKYDYFHFHLFPSFYFSLFVSKEKVIIHEHNTYNRRRDIKWLRPIEKYIYKRASAVICISESTKRSLVKWSGCQENIVVLNNFTRFEYKPLANIFLDNACVKVLMVASFTPQKRQKELIEAFCFLPKEYEMDFVGDGPFMETAREFAKKKDLYDRVFFHGVTDNVEKFYESANVCILNSNWEGFGMVVVEAASHNRVTLSSNVPGLSEVVERDELLFGNEIDPEELAEKIIKVVNLLKRNPNYYNDYNKYLSEKYSLSTYLVQLNNIYN